MYFTVIIVMLYVSVINNIFYISILAIPELSKTLKTISYMYEGHKRDDTHTQTQSLV